MNYDQKSQEVDVRNKENDTLNEELQKQMVAGGEGRGVIGESD